MATSATRDPSLRSWCPPLRLLLPQIACYLSRISGPLLDRIDIQVEVPRLPEADLLFTAAGEPSAAIRARVVAARQIQQERFGAGSRERGAGSRVYANAAMGPRQMKKHCVVDETALDLLQRAIRQLGLSARAYDRILRLSRTIADLAGSEAIAAGHPGQTFCWRRRCSIARSIASCGSEDESRSRPTAQRSAVA